ncbi:MAG: ParB N-terminal domain-containing protein [Alphaproteobacteria bacterium]|nr:ParB N-terminal domain-containing protein [Alphaproteobacteria bacterium]
MIPIDRIRVINPRVRNKKVFAGIIDNIASLGLKRPITVTPTGSGYDLVCGQGRLEAFQALGELEIPAIVIEASEQDCYLMSLIENLARRKHTNLDLLHGIRDLEDRGYTTSEIAAKTGLDQSYVWGISHLLKGGEERLIAAVEKNVLPLSMAVEISRSNEADLQNALADAYETGALRGDQLIRVRRLIERRRLMGKRYRDYANKTRRPFTANKLVQTYKDEVRRQKLMVKKAEVNEQRLLFLISALRRLLNDEHFRTLLRAEGFADMPQPLAERLHP